MAFDSPNEPKEAYRPRIKKATDVDISKLRDIEEYTHDDIKRANNLPVGMTQHDKSAEAVKTCEFDPHIDLTKFDDGL